MVVSNLVRMYVQMSPVLPLCQNTHSYLTSVSPLRPTLRIDHLSPPRPQHFLLNLETVCSLRLHSTSETCQEWLSWAETWNDDHRWILEPHVELPCKGDSSPGWILLIQVNNAETSMVVESLWSQWAIILNLSHGVVAASRVVDESWNSLLVI